MPLSGFTLWDSEEKRFIRESEASERGFVLTPHGELLQEGELADERYRVNLKVANG